MPQVSVVLPFRDQASMLAQACRSLQAQSLPDWECLLVNDGSAPEACSVAAGLAAADPRFRLLSVPEDDHYPGPWLARNFGLAHASSNLIAFLDADDLWDPHKLERQLPLHAEHSIELSVTAYYRFEAQSKKLIETRWPPHTIDHKALMRGNPIPLSTVIIHRDLLTQPFSPERHEDYGLWLRLFARVPPPRYGCLAEPLMAYRLHAASLSSQRGRSIFAVEKLFRNELQSPGRRLIAVSGWALERAWTQMKARGQRTLAKKAILPEPFSNYLTTDASIKDL
jgi:hypothetical protein